MYERGSFFRTDFFHIYLDKDILPGASSPPSLAILMTTYAHLARFARYSRCARNIPGTQDEPLGFASLASAARVMDEILTPIPIDLSNLNREKS